MVDDTCSKGSTSSPGILLASDLIATYGIAKLHPSFLCRGLVLQQCMIELQSLQHMLKSLFGNIDGQGLEHLQKDLDTSKCY